MHKDMSAKLSQSHLTDPLNQTMVTMLQASLVGSTRVLECRPRAEQARCGVWIED